MKIQLTIAEAQCLLAKQIGVAIENTTGARIDVDTIATVEITPPTPMPQPYQFKIAAIRALREDYYNRNDKESLSLAEAKRLVELIYTASGIPI